MNKPERVLGSLERIDRLESNVEAIKNKLEEMLAPPSMAEKEKIVPQDKGELWEDGDGEFYHTEYDEHDNLWMSSMEADYQVGRHLDLTGWKRLFRPVEGDVERIEVENVTWFRRKYEDGSVDVIDFESSLTHQNAKEFLDKPPMKMILIIPKESP